LRRSDLPTDTIALARSLVGATLVSDSADGRAVVRIVETEAYVPGDAASHAFRGKTPRNGIMFGRHGHAYVYFIYGSHFCLNVTSEPPGIGGGVLLRAAEPVSGIDLMRTRRPGIADRDLARGPGRLAAALGVDRAHDGTDLCAPGPLWLAAPLRPAPPPATSVRIGLTKEAHRPLRFFERGNRFVSGPASLNR
jgi:DNA-3-methyladenine glycosylase